MTNFLVLLCTKPNSDLIAVRTLLDGRSQLTLLRRGRAESINSDSDPIGWSPNGRWLVLGTKHADGTFSLSLVDTAAATLDPYELQGRSSLPTWTADGGTFFVSMKDKGILSVRVSGTEPQTSTSHIMGDRPDWSAASHRFAYLDSAGDLWVSSSEAGARKKLSSNARAAKWSPDGQSLAIVRTVNSKNELWLCSASGEDKRKLASVDSLETSWSPNGNSLLCRLSGDWKVTDMGQKTVSTGTGGIAPVWVDSKTLLANKEGLLQTFDIRSGSWRGATFDGLPEGQVMSFARFQGLVVEKRSRGPEAIPEPAKDRIRVTATVQALDVLNDRATLRVSSVLGSDKMELNFAQPVDQIVTWDANTTITQGSVTSPFRGTDLVPEASVVLWLKGSKAGVPEPLLVESLWMDRPITPSRKGSRDVERGNTRSIEYDGVCMDEVAVPMAFPLVDGVKWSDTFLRDRDGGARRHHGQDLMAEKMRPLVATFDGQVSFSSSGSGHHIIYVKGDCGWTSAYMHVNNDTPGTDDGKGGPRFAFAPGLKSGDRVVKGQLVGFCGDSGNAESVGSHCHFELREQATGGVFNAHLSLSEAEVLRSPIYPGPELGSKVLPKKHRWDMLVTKVDKDRDVLVGELIGEAGPGEAAQSILKPQLVYVKLSPGTRFVERATWADTQKATVTVGMYITVFGTPTGNSLSSLLVAVGAGLGD